ncbi:MAG: zf-HC2 domain-containing protein [Candidatus Omnitrophica bacterium]|nr:zf-HC2 domain-containing protein [Candidatus Omnitrophota bacterium]
MRFTCEDIKKRWPEYIYRELSEPEQSLFVRHLEECRHCRDEERQWREMLVEFDSIASLDGAMDAPPELVYRVKRQVGLYEDWSRQFTHQMRRWMVGAAAACFLMIGGVYGVLPGLIMPQMEINNVSSPFQKSVLQTIYDSDTLQFFSEQGILDESENNASKKLVDVRTTDQSFNMSENSTSL